MTLSYCAIIAITLMTLGVLASLVRANGRLSSEDRQRFYLICLVIGLAACSEWLAVLLDGAPLWTTRLHLVAKFLDYSITPVCSLLFIRQMSSNIRLQTAMRWLLICNTVLEFLSIFTGWTFYVDAMNIHRHGPLYLFYVAVSLCAIASVFMAFLDYGRRYDDRYRGPVVCICLLLAVSVAFQECFGGEVRTDYLGMAISITMLYIHYVEFRQIDQDLNILKKDRQLFTDALTGVLSRFAYMQVASEYEGAPALPEKLAAFEADLNGLKRVNDNVGHEAGDELLQAAGQVLQEVIAEHGKVFRTGGDEFVILLDTAKLPAKTAESRIREKAENWQGKLSSGMSFSIGCAEVSEFPDYSLQQLVHAADQRMYADKERYYSIPGHDRRTR